MADGEIYIVAIAALLPVTASMLVLQTNPYHALVIRGILGAVAALVYALFGAADVALTEALVGTMLSITLYAVAVRSSLNLRLGILESGQQSIQNGAAAAAAPLLLDLRRVLSRHHMRLELIPYEDTDQLQAALAAKEIHATCLVAAQQHSQKSLAEPSSETPLSFQLQTRIRRLHDIAIAELDPDLARLSYVEPDALERVLPEVRS
ncbi:MAG: DUF4040 domain-containing protein [Cyanobacteria bacterium J06641_5]